VRSAERPEYAVLGLVDSHGGGCAARQRPEATSHHEQPPGHISLGGVPVGSLNCASTNGS